MKFTKVLVIMIGIVSFSIIPMAANAPAGGRQVASTPLPGVSAGMEGVEFWIAKLPSPDVISLSSAEISALNRQYAQREETLNLAEDLPGDYDGAWLKETILKEFTDFSKQTLYDAEGKALTPSFWKEVYADLDLEAIPARVLTSYGVLTSFGDLRILPISQNLNSQPGDIHFDQVQQSGYDAGTAHVIYHTSKDGKWVYAQNRSYRGWYSSASIGICDLEDYNLFSSQHPKLVISSVMAIVYSEAMRSSGVIGKLRMGAILPLNESVSHATYNPIYYPLRSPEGNLKTVSAFVLQRDSQVNFLDFTPRNALTQAFKLLNQAYGWGDMNQAWDCSSLMQSVFHCFGVYLPRNGGDQAGALFSTLSFVKETSTVKERAIIEASRPGLSLIRMPGHIMLYIGSHEGKAYVLHDVYAYRVPKSRAPDQTILINKTVVSDLHLGKGSQRGSWLERVSSVVGFTP